MILVYSNNREFYNSIKKVTDEALLLATNSKHAISEFNNTDLLILDGKTVKDGAMSFYKQANLECNYIPPAIIFTERKEDKFIAAWSGIKTIFEFPIKPFELLNSINNILQVT
jgi:DNA-binding response OmpR family regulator